ncbi:uncharacterized protein LOC116609934 isoform X3 [Nematostella vectensis]|nr:uncharacterized protein LOC116609934 isoform X3 [Nematostella vectensis]
MESKRFWHQMMERKNENSFENFTPRSRSRTNSNEVPLPLNAPNMRIVKRKTSSNSTTTPVTFGPRPRAYTDPTDLLWICRQRGTWLQDNRDAEHVKENRKDSKHKLPNSAKGEYPPCDDRACLSTSSESDRAEMDENCNSIDNDQFTMSDRKPSMPCRMARRGSLVPPGPRRLGRRGSEVPALTSLARRRNSTAPVYPVGLKRRGSRGFSNAEFHFSNIQVKARHEMLANLVLPAFGDPSSKLRERRVTYACHPTTKRTKKDEKRYLATKEILVTEKSYLACLSTLKTAFEEPMRESALIGSKEIDVIFPKELDHIRESHTLFMNELEDRIQNWRQYGIVGDIFTKLSSSYHINVLMIYSNYVNNFPKAIAAINKFSRASHKFRKFLQDCSMEPACAGLDLPAYLLTPIQRLPRYVLLLRQVSKYTEASHPDSFHLKNALEKMTQMINLLNDSIQNSHKVVNSASPRKNTRKTKSLRKKASLKELKSKKENCDIVSKLTPEMRNDLSSASVESELQSSPTMIRTTAEATQESLTSIPTSPSSPILSPSPHSVLSRVRSGERKCRPVSAGDLDQFYDSENLREFTSITEENEDKDQKSPTQSKLKMAKDSMTRAWQRRSKKWRRSVDEIFTDSKSDSTSAISELGRDFPIENRTSDSSSIAPSLSPTGTISHSTSEQNVFADEDAQFSKDKDTVKKDNELKHLSNDSAANFDFEISVTPSSADASPSITLTRRRKVAELWRPVSLMLPSQLAPENGNARLKATSSESHMVATDSESDIWVRRPMPQRSRFTRSSSDGVRQLVMRSRQASVTSCDRRISICSNGSLNESEDSGVSGTPETSPSNTLRSRGRKSKNGELEVVDGKVPLRHRRSWEKLFVADLEFGDEEQEEKTNKKKFKDVMKNLFKRKSSLTGSDTKTSSPTSSTRSFIELGEKISTV